MGMQQYLLLAAIGACATLTGGCREAGSAPLDGPALVARGQYLVDQVAMCADCHAPRGADGAFDRKNWLMGSPLAFAPTVPMPAWAEVAPPLAGGYPGWTEAELVKFLVDGKNPKTGVHPRPPMPEFRFEPADAGAGAAYLHSLPRPGMDAAP